MSSFTSAYIPPAYMISTAINNLDVHYTEEDKQITTNFWLLLLYLCFILIVQLKIKRMGKI